MSIIATPGKWPNREESFSESYAQLLPVFESKCTPVRRARFLSRKSGAAHTTLIMMLHSKHHQLYCYAVLSNTRPR
jgi:hypothetical protein